jgi:type II secretory pathway component PulM
MPVKAIPDWRRRWRRALLPAGLALVLTLTFLAYLQPGFIMDVANRILLCF